MPGTVSSASSAFLLLLISLSACSKQPESSPPPATPLASSPEPATVELEAAEVSRAMRGNEDDYRKCFLRAVSRRGAVQLQFSVDQGGQVQEAELTKSSVGAPHVEQCLLERLREQRFGQRSQPARGRWTFVFRLSDPIAAEERDALLDASAEDARNPYELVPSSEGTIDAGKVDEMIQVRYPLYAHCYRDSIRRRGESRGIVRFRLDIDEGGAVTEIQDDGSVLPDAFAVDCMAEAFYAIDFPRPTGGPVSIRVGLNFE